MTQKTLKVSAVIIWKFFPRPALLTDMAYFADWSKPKKYLVTFLICWITFTVYIGSSLITSSFPSLMSSFNVSEEAATVTLAVYVFFYGAGAVIFSPLSEIPRFGRNLFYVIPFFMFLLFQIGASTVKTFGGLIVLRIITCASLRLY